MQKWGLSKDTLRGDISAGIITTILGLPGALAYGIIVFTPLGPEFIPLGMVAGLTTLVFANIGSVLFSSNPYLIYAPDALSTVILASALTIILGSDIGGSAPPEAALALAFLFLILFISGLLQLFFGLLKLGNLAKYIPDPVVAGLTTGVSIIIIKGQIYPIFGLPSGSSLTDFEHILSNMELLPFVVGIATVLIILNGSKLTKRIPPLILGILVGTALYYSFSLLSHGQTLGPVVGFIPIGIPSPHYALPFVRIFTTPDLLNKAIKFSPLMGSLAIAISLKTLVTTVTVDNAAQRRSEINREFIGQGLANMLTAVFGGLAGTGHQGASMANYQSGGRTAHSRLFSGIFTLLAVLLLGPLVARIPRVVLAGLLVAVALRMTDDRAKDLITRFLKSGGKSKEIIADLIIVLAVAAILVIYGIFQGIAVGIITALGLFIYRMSEEGIRRKYNASKVRSNVDRSEREIELLEQHGHKIHLFELKGALFFGTADRLADLIDPTIWQDVAYIILDLRKISYVDSTGANTLVQLKNKYVKYKKSLIVSGIDIHESHNSFLTALGTLDKIGMNSIFPSIDDALAWAEDQLLDDLIGVDRYDSEVDITAVDALSRLSLGELELFLQYCTRETYENGETILTAGDCSDHILIILQGRVDIYTNYDDFRRRDRIATLGPGTLLGELGILDEQPRAATAVANGEFVGFVLSTTNLRQLEDEQPAIAFKFMVGLGRALAKRIRIMNALTTELRA